jgi:hypothetical protein
MLYVSKVTAGFSLTLPVARGQIHNTLFPL